MWVKYIIVDKVNLIYCFCYFQDENMMNFIKGGMKVRNSYQIYK